MGHLAEKCSTGVPAWERYVVTNPTWNTRWYRLYCAAPFHMGTCQFDLPKATPVRILSPIFHTFHKRKWAFVQWGLRRGYIPLSGISKPFAGRQSFKESAARQQLETQMINLNTAQSPINVAIRHGNTAVFWANGVSVVNTFNQYPKADFALQAANGQFLLYVSHKSGANAGRFQQYSGVSERAGDRIANHPEVQDFLDYVASMINLHGQIPYSVSRPIRDANLVGAAVFGPEYGSDFTSQNVTVIGQGMPTLAPYGDDYALDFETETALNGKLDMFMADTSEYRAMLVAFRSSADRGFKRQDRFYTHVRVGIYPMAFLKGRK